MFIGFHSVLLLNFSAHARRDFMSSTATLPLKLCLIVWHFVLCLSIIVFPDGVSLDV